MDQLEFFAIPNPCHGVCQTNKQGYCLKCLRSREERFNWFTYSDAQKQQVLRLCKQRRNRQRYLLGHQRDQASTATLQQSNFDF